MANIFGIITTILLALSALVAYKNKEAHGLKVTETEAARQTLSKNEARLTATKEVLVALPEQRAAVDAEIVTLQDAESKQTKINAAAKTEVETITVKIAKGKETLDGIREKTSKIGDLKELSSKMRATSGELEALSQEISGAEAKLANLTAMGNDAASKVTEEKRKIDSYSTGQSYPTLHTRIRSIYPNWGFVTLAAGNNAGVVGNSTLNVIRNGQTIARLLVTAVETSSSSASIVPDSMSGDVTLMVGDQVVPGVSDSKTATKTLTN
jgi:DNA repair exonuclease SbcCD ATPase subunit